MNAWRDYISHEIDVSKVLDADFNFLKINLTSHWVEQISQYRALQQEFAKSHEQAHITKVKDGLEHLQLHSQLTPTSNHLSASHSLIQNRQAQSPISCSALRAQYCRLQRPLLRCGPGCPLVPQSYLKDEFVGPQIRRDGQHPDAIIKDFRGLLNNTQDVTHRVAIYCSTCKFITHKSRSKKHI
jgi:hypothetical protein